MQKVAILYRLQLLDLEVEEKTQRLRDVEGRLGETQELLAAREAAAKAQAEEHAAAVQLREQEFQVSHVEGKLKEANAALYSGKARPARELSNLQKEAELLAQQKSRAEDAVLEAMDRLEGLQAAAARARESLAAVEAAWRQEQADLTEQKALLEAQLAKLAAEREGVAREAEPAHLPVYENLRRQRGGRAVARVEQSVCGGCRVMIPIQQVQRARSNPGLSFCGTCGRILYVPR